MTIVASNNLTVSNVNDGTITHTAYANSADGTNGFTTDYKSAVGLDILNVINWAKNTSMSNSTYKFSSNTDSSFKVTGKGTSGFEVLSKSFLAKIGDKLRFTVRYTNRLAFGLFNNYGLQFVTSGVYTESVTSTSKIVLPNAITSSTEYQLEYTATTSNVWMQLNFGGVADSAQVDFDVKIEVENLTNPVKYAYMGTYSDYTATASTDPAKYAPWTVFKGEDGVGVKTTVITYAMSTSGTTAPTAGWTSSVPGLVKGQYLWTKTVWTYTDNSSETGYSVTYISKDGTNGIDGTSGIIVSSVAPDSPQTGQLWQDTSTIPQLVKKWNGTAWVLWELYAQNLKADTLEALSAKIGKIYNEFDNSSGGIDNKGTITIEDSVKVVYYLGNSSTTIDLVTSSSGQGLFTQHLPDKTDASKFKQAWYMPTGLYFTDSINNWTGQITAEQVTRVPWTDITLASGYTSADGTTAQYRVIRNLDGTKHVEFRGSVGKTSGNLTTSQVQIGTLPAIITPSQNTFKQASIDGAEGGRIGAISDRRLMAWCAKETRYISLDSLTYTL